MATTQRPGSKPGAAKRTLPAGSKTRSPLFKHPWRIVIVVGSLIVVANLGILLLHKSDTSLGGLTFPNAIDSVTPNPGEIIRPQDSVGADLRSGLTGVLTLSGPGFNEQIPLDQTDRVAPLGQLSFRPGPGKDIRQFAPGAWSAVVQFWSDKRSPSNPPKHPGSFSWSFRVGA